MQLELQYASSMKLSSASFLFPPLFSRENGKQRAFYYREVGSQIIERGEAFLASMNDIFRSHPPPPH